jgi:hypothetical protein
MNTDELTDRRELAAEFRQAAERAAIRIRIQNAPGEGSIEDLEHALGLVNELATFNGEEPAGDRLSLPQTYETSIYFSNSTIA